MGETFAKIVIAVLVVVALYNVFSSPNTQGIVQGSLSGSASVIKALEGH